MDLQLTFPSITDNDIQMQEISQEKFQNNNNRSDVPINNNNNSNTLNNLQLALNVPHNTNSTN